MRILHTMLRVGDLQRSIDFYTQILGMQLLGPVNTNPMPPVVPEKASIKARGEKFGYSK